MAGVDRALLVPEGVTLSWSVRNDLTLFVAHMNIMSAAGDVSAQCAALHAHALRRLQAGSSSAAATVRRDRALVGGCVAVALLQHALLHQLS